ncbi:MAG: orotate phosphoribosyltransferase [Calditrichaeota bacterium]|nr:orotate phosphoribosyltransferase [Calditrichota bacterium]
MEMTQVEQILRDAGAFLKGHFLYASKLHGEVYIEKFRAIENPQVTSELCAELIARAPAPRPRVVVGPLTGGALMAFEIARQIGALAYFTEKIDGRNELRRGFQIDPGEPVWIAEDVVNLGGSISDVVKCVQAAGGVVTAALILVDRSKGRVAFDFPFIPLLQVTDLIEYRPEECPLCRKGIPLVAPGGRKASSPGKF